MPRIMVSPVFISAQMSSSTGIWASLICILPSQYLGGRLNKITRIIQTGN